MGDLYYSPRDLQMGRQLERRHAIEMLLLDEPHLAASPSQLREELDRRGLAASPATLKKDLASLGLAPPAGYRRPRRPRKQA